MAVVLVVVEVAVVVAGAVVTARMAAAVAKVVVGTVLYRFATTSQEGIATVHTATTNTKVDLAH